MIYYYQITYDEHRDEFFGLVANRDRTEIPYHIDNTPTMVRLIKHGHMSHVDDVEGLEKYLKDAKIIKLFDTVIFNDVVLV